MKKFLLCLALIWAHINGRQYRTVNGRLQIKERDKTSKKYNYKFITEDVEQIKNKIKIPTTTSIPQIYPLHQFEYKCNERGITKNSFIQQIYNQLQNKTEIEILQELNIIAETAPYMSKNEFNLKMRFPNEYLYNEFINSIYYNAPTEEQLVKNVNIFNSTKYKECPEIYI